MSEPTLQDVYEALAGVTCWCRGTSARGASSSDVLLALAGVEICEVCNNGVNELGWWFPEVADGSKHHCTSCHGGSKDLHHDGTRCVKTHAAWDSYARCYTCGEAVQGPRPTPGGGQAFWKGHVCRHTCALGEGTT